MKAWNVTKDQLEKALEWTSKDWAHNVRWKKQPTLKGKAWEFSITVVNSKEPGGRVKKNGAGGGTRRIAAACWHVHRDFMEYLYLQSKNAVIDTAFIRYEGVMDFLENHEATFDRNCGSQAFPQKYGETCECLDNS